MLNAVPVSTSWWTDSTFLAYVAIVVALLAAAFTGWQAAIAFQTRRAANDRASVEWAAPEWVAANTIELRSNGPVEARDVWARLTIDGVSYEQTGKLVRQGEALRFKISGKRVSWDWHVHEAPADGEPFNDGAAFYWGPWMNWVSRRGTPQEIRTSGAIMRRLRLDHLPYPHGVPEPDDS